MKTKGFAELGPGPDTSKDADMTMSEACDSDVPLATLAKRKADAGADGVNSPVAPRPSAKRPKTAHKDVDTESRSPEAEPEAAEPSIAEVAVNLPKTKEAAALSKKKVLHLVSQYQCIACLQVQDQTNACPTFIACALRMCGLFSLYAWSSRRNRGRVCGSHGKYADALHAPRHGR